MARSASLSIGPADGDCALRVHLAVQPTPQAESIQRTCAAAPAYLSAGGAALAAGRSLAGQPLIACQADRDEAARLGGGPLTLVPDMQSGLFLAESGAGILFGVCPAMLGSLVQEGRLSVLPVRAGPPVRILWECSSPDAVPVMSALSEAFASRKRAVRTDRSVG